MNFPVDFYLLPYVKSRVLVGRPNSTLTLHAYRLRRRSARSCLSNSIFRKERLFSCRSSSVILLSLSSRAEFFSLSGRCGPNIRPITNGAIPITIPIPINTKMGKYCSNIITLKIPWCRRPDLNRHDQKATTPSRWRVYQFHHFGINL